MICNCKYHRIALYIFIWCLSISIVVSMISQFWYIYSPCKCNHLSALYNGYTSKIPRYIDTDTSATRHKAKQRNIIEIYVNCHHDLLGLCSCTLPISRWKSMLLSVPIPSLSVSLPVCLSRCLYLFYFTFNVRPLHKWKINKFLNDNTLHGICRVRAESASKLKLMLIGARVNQSCKGCQLSARGSSMNLLK